MMDTITRRLGAADTLARIATALDAGEVQDAVADARASLLPAPTTTVAFALPADTRVSSATVKVKNLRPATRLAVYLRDGFVDRYSPERWRLVHPGALRVLSLRLGSAMPTELSRHGLPAHYASNAPVWFDVWPTVDHITARSNAARTLLDNLVTCSWWRNDSKRARHFVDTGWDLQPAGDLRDWDGLTDWFLRQVAEDPRLLDDRMVRNWHLPATVPA